MSQPAFSNQYQPPPPPPANPQTMTTISVVTTALGPTLGPFPAPVKCPHCYQSVISQTTPVSGLATYLLAGGCCLLG